MKIFLTGSTGFIGSHFLNMAMEKNWHVRALKRTSASVPRISLKNEPGWIEKSLDDVEVLDLNDVDVLVHLAAHSANVPYDTLENCIKYNVMQPLNLFKKAVEGGVKKIVVAGSCFEYGGSGEKYDYIPTDAALAPLGSYPTSKAMASLAFLHFAREFNVDLSIHRIFHVYGEGEAETRLWPSLKKAALKGENFPMTKGEQIRDFISVSEVVEHFLRVCETSEPTPKVQNVGSGKPQSILEFSKFWWNKWKAQGELEVGSIPYRTGEVMRFVPQIDKKTKAVAK